MHFLLILIALLAPTVCNASTHSLYISGVVKHFDPDPETKEGYVPLLGYSYKLEQGGWVFDTGGNIFIDSYSQPSVSAFSNISHKSFTYKYLTPMVGLGVTNKGSSYEDDSRQTYPFISPKLKIGTDSIFCIVSVMPEWVGLEFGFSW